VQELIFKATMTNGDDVLIFHLIFLTENQ